LDTVVDTTPSNDPNLADLGSGGGPSAPATTTLAWFVLMRLRLFASAYAPLGLIVAARSAPKSLILALLWAGASAGAFAWGATIVRSAVARGAVRRTFHGISDAGGSVAGYLATYLLPFVTAGATTWGDVLAYAIYFAVLFSIYARSDMLMVSPAVYLIRRRVVAGLDEDNRPVFVICAKVPDEGVATAVVNMGGIWVTKE
jgi:hypothetical protein